MRYLVETEAERISEITEFLHGEGDFRYNEVLGKVEFRRKDSGKFIEITDYELNSLSRRMAERNIKCSPEKVDELLKSDLIPLYDPFKDYIAQLKPWDGKIDYIDNLANTVKTTNQDFWRICFKKWIVAVIGSLNDEYTVNHTVPVLVGEQGCGKTTWIDKLVPTDLRRNYYYSGTVNLGNKDSVIMLSESMLINMEELTTLSPKQLNELKEIITKKQIRIRRPYGRVNETLPRRASFIGSTNENKILSDTTGSRRFLVFNIVKIETHSINIDEVYSQAWTLYKEQFRFWFNHSEIQDVNRNNEQFRSRTIEEELLLQTFSPADPYLVDEFYTATQIMVELCRTYNIPSNNAVLRRIGQALNLHSFSRIKRDGIYVYRLRRNQEATQFQTLPNKIRAVVGKRVRG